MNSYDGNKNFLIKHPYKKILLPIKFLIDFLQSYLSNLFRFMNYSSIDKNLINYINSNYKTGIKVLDFGSGFGNFAYLFEKNDYLGIDINSAYINRAKTLNPNYQFLNIDLSKFKLKNKCDLVLIYGVLHHIPDNEVKLILMNIKNALVDNGKIYIYEPLPPQSIFNIKSLLMKNLDLGNYIRTNNELISLLPNDLTYDEHSLIPKTDHIRVILKK